MGLRWAGLAAGRFEHGQIAGLTVRGDSSSGHGTTASSSEFEEAAKQVAAGHGDGKAAGLDATRFVAKQLRAGHGRLASGLMAMAAMRRCGLRSGVGSSDADIVI
ncbi:hypothetical protein M0R45_008929 [Rubus argutus]|uniref:Uncharacterized protein n=1 Tax=Rubus argutus TaxID=59490 RepID=A0AAW1Y2N6_RUBAR